VHQEKNACYTLRVQTYNTFMAPNERTEAEIINEYLTTMRRRGGQNSRKNLSPAQKTKLARKAANARWGKKRAAKKV
jgi:hypothetical protein